MNNDKAVLSELVALKRRRAEQRLAAAQIEMDRAQAAMQGLIEDLKSVDRLEIAPEDRLLSLAKGRTVALSAQIAAAKVSMATKQEEAQEARDALKRALYSENQIGKRHDD